MNIEVAERIPEVIKIKPTVYKDERGHFCEFYKDSEYAHIIKNKVVQDNISYSRNNVLRGLHYQVFPMEQGKLVTCISGQIWDVAVDIRPRSKTLGEWTGFVLDGNKKEQVWIPPGFAHGFYTLSRTATIMYKVTSEYSKENERTLLWNDNQINIDWKIGYKKPILSEKDSRGISFKNIMLELV
jgi:dTDP-4-dehydrorhamnose 3,5-epimerase